MNEIKEPKNRKQEWRNRICKWVIVNKNNSNRSSRRAFIKKMGRKKNSEYAYYDFKKLSDASKKEVLNERQRKLTYKFSNAIRQGKLWKGLAEVKKHNKKMGD